MHLFGAPLVADISASSVSDRRSRWTHAERSIEQRNEIKDGFRANATRLQPPRSLSRRHEDAHPFLATADRTHHYSSNKTRLITLPHVVPL